jgi:hypothetical protein
MTGERSSQKPEAGAVSFDAQIVLRPRSIDETFDLALVYLRASFWPFFRLFFVLAALATGFVAGVSILFGLKLVQSAAVALLVSPILERVVTVYAGRHLFRNDPKIGQSILAVMKRIVFAVFWAAIIALPWAPMMFDNFSDSSWIALAVILGCFWPFVLAFHVHLGEVAHLEQLSAGRVARRARTLVAYRFARGLGLVIMSAIIRILIAGLVELTAQFIMGFVLQFGDVHDSIGGWPAIFGYFIAGMYIAMARLFDYVDARTRREGWDIQVRFNAIAQREKDAGARRIAA